MEVKNKVVFEIQKEDRLYRLELPSGAPLGECYESCCKFIEKVLEYINQHYESIRPKSPEELTKDPTNEKDD